MERLIVSTRTWLAVFVVVFFWTCLGSSWFMGFYVIDYDYVMNWRWRFHDSCVCGVCGVCGVCTSLSVSWCLSLSSPSSSQFMMVKTRNWLFMTSLSNVSRVERHNVSTSTYMRIYQPYSILFPLCFFFSFLSLSTWRSRLGAVHVKIMTIRLMWHGLGLT